MVCDVCYNSLYDVYTLCYYNTLVKSFDIIYIRISSSGPTMSCMGTGTRV